MRVQDSQRDSINPLQRGGSRPGPLCPISISRAQARADALVSSFVNHATDGYSLAGMVGGGLVYRLGRVGTLALGSRLVGAYGRTPLHLLIRPASIGLAFTGEVFTFEAGQRALRVGIGGADPNLLRWTGENGLGRGLVGAAITLGSLKGAGAFVQGQNPVLQHLFQDSAMVLAHNVHDRIFARRGTLQRAPTLAEQFLNAEATLWQMNAGMALVHGAAPGLRQAERSLDLSVAYNSPQPPLRLRGGEEGTPPLKLRGGWEGLQSLQPLFSAAGINPNIFTGPLRMTALPPAGGAERPRHRVEDFLPLFPSQGTEAEPRRLIQNILAIESEFPGFHESILQALAAAANRASLSQEHTSLALRELFSFDALNASTGSLDNALLQSLIYHSLAQGNPQRRQQDLLQIFFVMETGLSRQKITGLFDHLGYGQGLAIASRPIYTQSYWERHRFEVEELWQGYGPEDQLAMFNQVFSIAGRDPSRASRFIDAVSLARTGRNFDPREIDLALAYARTHPLGQLILNRIFQVFITDDVPAKLREIYNERGELDTPSSIAAMTRHGLGADQVAERIDGTFHTGYLSDLRLARKVVVTALHLHRIRQMPDERRQEARDRTQAAIEAFLHSGRPLSSEALVEILSAFPSPRIASLRRNLRPHGRLQIEIVSPEDFAKRSQGWGRVDQPFSLFRLGRARGEPDQIFVQQMPRLNLSDPREYEEALEQLEMRAMAVVHEYEHWRHFRGSYEGIEQGAEPFDAGSLSRQDRLVLEIMAYLEEQAWTFENFNVNRMRTANRVGQNLALYYRTITDMGYYRKANERLARDFFGR